MSDLTNEEAYNQRLILGLTTTLLALCYAFYFLRILSRKLLETALWFDDWFMLLALVGLLVQAFYAKTDSRTVCLQRDEWTQLRWQVSWSPTQQRNSLLIGSRRRIRFWRPSTAYDSFAISDVLYCGKSGFFL